MSRLIGQPQQRIILGKEAKVMDYTYSADGRIQRMQVAVDRNGLQDGVTSVDVVIPTKSSLHGGDTKCATHANATALPQQRAERLAAMKVSYTEVLRDRIDVARQLAQVVAGRAPVGSVNHAVVKDVEVWVDHQRVSGTVLVQPITWSTREGMSQISADRIAITFIPAAASVANATDGSMEFIIDRSFADFGASLVDRGLALLGLAQQ